MSADYKQNANHRSVLEKNVTFLKDSVTLSHGKLTDELLGSSVLNDYEVNEIESKITEQEKVDQLLHNIMRASHVQYLKFLKSLNKADRKSVV